MLFVWDFIYTYVYKIYGFYICLYIRKYFASYIYTYIKILILYVYIYIIPHKYKYVYIDI